MGRLPGLFTGMLLLTGCQLGVLQGSETGMGPDEFARIWGLYQDCRSAELATILAQTPRWERMAAAPSRLPVRLSVDPRALAAACAIHAGNLALSQGERELAVEWFSLVIQRYPEADYAYYVAQAWAGLNRAAESATPTVALIPNSLPR